MSKGIALLEHCDDVNVNQIFRLRALAQVVQGTVFFLSNILYEQNQ